MTILLQTSQDTVFCIIGSQSFDIGEMLLIRSTEGQVLSLPDFVSGFFHLHQKFIEGNGSPDSPVNIVFEFSLPTVAILYPSTTKYKNVWGSLDTFLKLL